MIKQFKSGALAAAMALTTTTASAEILIRYQHIDNPDRDDKWFVADSFSFGVEREMKESGEKGGTEDINIGVGELQEISISKRIDASTVDLAHMSLTGRTLGPVEICVTDPASGSDTRASSAEPVCYLRYKLDRCFVKSWSTSGDADDRPTEEVAFYYNKIAFQYAKYPGVIAWDNERNRPWLDGERELPRR